LALPATGLVCLTLLSACNLGASPEVAPLPVATPSKPAEPATSELMAQLLPPNSCPNTLENLKFAMKTKLFTRDDFYTDENVRRFFGDYYDITWDKNPNIKKVSIWNGYRTKMFYKNELPWAPCFREGELSKSQVKEKDKEVTRSFFYARSESYYHIGIDLFETVFGYSKPDAIRPFQPYFSPRHGSRQLSSEEMKNIIPHQYGRKKLNYFYKNNGYQASIEVETNLAGSILVFTIASTGE